MDEPLGTRIRRARLEAGYSQAELARRVYVDKAYLSRVENGHQAPSPALLRALSNTLGVRLFVEAEPAYSGRGPASDGVALVPVRLSSGRVVITVMDRRAFLATAAAAVSGSVAGSPMPEKVNRDTVTALSDRLDWHVAAGRVLNPEDVSRLLCGDLDMIGEAIKNASSELRAPLLAISARYAEYLGWMRQEADDTQGALYWTDRSSDYALAADWRHMVSYTMSRKALIVLPDQPAYAADLARIARTGPWKLTPGLAALAASQEAEAHAHAGREADFRRSMDVARRYAERLDPADEPPIGPRARSIKQILDTRVARGDLALGRPEPAVDYLAPVVTSANNPKWRATDGALLGLAYAKAGAVDEACVAAYEAARSGASCVSATAVRELRALRAALLPWSNRDDVRAVLDALPA